MNATQYHVKKEEEFIESRVIATTSDLAPERSFSTIH